MRTPGLVIAAAAASLLLAVVPASAAPITFDFSDGTVGQVVGPVAYGPGLVVQGYSSGSAAPLYRRDDFEDHGFGVCSPDDISAGACHSGETGEGDWNELDNHRYPELIRLELPDGYTWVSVGLSSLDTKERGQLWGDNDGDVTNGLGSVICQFDAFGPFNGCAVQNGTSVEPTLLIPEAYQSAPYLVFQPYDWVSTCHKSDDNDFLVYTATIEPIPEPATLVLLAGGLLGLAARRRRT